jgi:hypothetical protein
LPLKNMLVGKQEQRKAPAPATQQAHSLSKIPVCLAPVRAGTRKVGEEHHARHPHRRKVTAAAVAFRRSMALLPSPASVAAPAEVQPTEPSKMKQDLAPYQIRQRRPNPAGFSRIGHAVVLVGRFVASCLDCFPRTAIIRHRHQHLVDMLASA